MYISHHKLINTLAVIAIVPGTLNEVGSQYKQTRRSVGGCRAVLRKNRLEFHSCDDLATMSRQRLRVL